MGTSWTGTVAFVVACSGPGAMAAILAAERHGTLMWALAAGTVAVGIAVRAALGARPTSYGSLAGLALLILHPALFIGARGGDCGRLRLLACAADSVVVMGWLFAAVGWAAIARRRAARA